VFWERGGFGKGCISKASYLSLRVSNRREKTAHGDDRQSLQVICLTDTAPKETCLACDVYCSIISVPLNGCAEGFGDIAEGYKGRVVYDYGNAHVIGKGGIDG
jgi:hypothetical protein